jgi:predicted small lipoprotein YifL
MSDLARRLARGGPVAAVTLMLLSGCGQTGKLYLPESAQGEVITRPTQTPPPESGSTSNSPRSVDSPPVPDTPAPEVTAPEEDGKKDKKDGAQSPPQK